MIVVCTFVIAADCHLPVLGSGPDSRGGGVPFNFYKKVMLMRKGVFCVSTDG